MRIRLRQAIEGVQVRVSQLNTLELMFPVSPGVLVEGALFAFDSAFPGPGVLRPMARVGSAVERKPRARLVVFGHTDVQGSEAHNKGLSERRAKALVAMLQQNLALFDEVAEADGWDVGVYQAMLRTLACNPGAIDGDEGPYTQAALKGFQEDYNAEAFHSHERAPARTHGDLKVDGVLGARSKAALRDAYLALAPTRIEASRFNDPAFAGCSEFNPVSTEHAENRRASIALIENHEPAAEDFPCQEGDIASCPVDDQKPMRCKFHRRYFEEKKAFIATPFFDFRWLREEDGHAHLSALTSFADGTPVMFTVYRWQEPLPARMPQSTFQGGAPPTPRQELGRVDGEVRGGVAFARWMPPEGFDPFDMFQWLVDHDVDLAIGDDSESASVSGDDLAGMPAAHPPVFRVEAEQAWGFSRPPSIPLRDIRIAEAADGQGTGLGDELAQVPWESAGGDLRALGGLGHGHRVVALFMARHALAGEEDRAEPGEEA